MSKTDFLGVVALILADSTEPISPKQMKKLLTDNCTKKSIEGLPAKTPNCLVYSLISVN
jgi:hypothetical protein